MNKDIIVLILAIAAAAASFLLVQSKGGVLVDAVTSKLPGGAES